MRYIIITSMLCVIAYGVGVERAERRLEAEYEEVSKHWLRYYEGCHNCKEEK